jgi:hypothetical protein
LALCTHVNLVTIAPSCQAQIRVKEVKTTAGKSPNQQFRFTSESLEHASSRVALNEIHLPEEEHRIPGEKAEK